MSAKGRVEGTWMEQATEKCYCGHAQGTHVNACGLCLAKRCFCLIFRQTSAGRSEPSPDE